MFLWKKRRKKKTPFGETSVLVSLAELLWMKLKFQQSYLEKHSAYYTAQFPILSQVRTQTHTHCHTQNTKWGRRTKRSPRQAQWYKKHIDKKEKTAIMWDSGGIVTIHILLHIRKKHNNISHSIKRTCIAQTEMVISITLHEAAVGWNGVAARRRQALGHYTTPEWGAVIAVGEYNQVLCLSLSNL